MKGVQELLLLKLIHRPAFTRFLCREQEVRSGVPLEGRAVPKGFQDERYRRLIGMLISERQTKGMSQASLAEALGTHQQFVSRFETGERRLDIIEIVDVAACLGIDATQLIEAAKDPGTA